MWTVTGWWRIWVADKKAISLLPTCRAFWETASRITPTGLEVRVHLDICCPFSVVPWRDESFLVAYDLCCPVFSADPGNRKARKLSSPWRNHLVLNWTFTFTHGSSYWMRPRRFRLDQQDYIPTFLFWLSLRSDTTKMQNTYWGFLHLTRSAPFQKTQRALLKICPLPKHFSPPDYMKPITLWLWDCPSRLDRFF